MTGSVSAMGVESITRTHSQTNALSLNQLELAINAINTQVYSLALINNSARQPHAVLKIENVNVPIQYGFVKDKTGLAAILEQTILELGTINRIKNQSEITATLDCVLYYQPPKALGSTAKITINSNGC